MHRTSSLACVVLAVVACGTPATSSPSMTPAVTPNATPAASALATPGATESAVPSEGWTTDISRLVPRMDALHPQLDHGVPLGELNAAAAELATQAATASDDELLDGVMRVAAMVSREGCDAHTGAYVWGSTGYPLNSLPLRLWLFDDGAHIVDALDSYRPLIGGRIVTIGGMPVDEVIERLKPLIPRDNDWTVRLLTPRYLLMPQVLAGIGVP